MKIEERVKSVERITRGSFPATDYLRVVLEDGTTLVVKETEKARRAYSIGRYIGVEVSPR